MTIVKNRLTPAERSVIREELGWLHEDPVRLANLLTGAEERQVLKLGYVPKDLWAALRKRL
ncbi:hypothetical protein [uncultured Halomonas sp.]|uniref:hypothetical protein n=1 Tax=uncultured Halomonas sp. TaxID=173971 RepID=UPI00261B9FEF|nr:hypothetical protein [uncultured Halomonas sp.]